MSNQEKEAALREVVAGSPVHDIRFTAGHVVVKNLCEGVAPSNSPLKAPGIKLFVAAAETQSAASEEIVLALEHSAPGEAHLSLMPVKDGVENNVRYLREATDAAARALGYDTVIFDPEAGALTEETYAQIGCVAVGESSFLRHNVYAQAA